DFLSKYTYTLPNKDYERLFWKAKKVNLKEYAPSNGHSARWLVPNNPIAKCKPVFVANSMLSAI
ncbi:hypothetical protein K469DRAFT_565619, partial [Zopfia rhizophila CBS 207.26]